MITPVIFWFESVGFPLLSLLTLTPLFAMIAGLASRSPIFMVRIAYVATLLEVLLGLYLIVAFDTAKTGIQFAEQFSGLGVSYSVGVDGLNILFIPLVTFAAFLILVYISATRSAGNSRLIVCVLGYETILIGAFSALNVLQFWLLTALELVPILLLTVQSGLDQKKRHLMMRLLQFFCSSLFLTLSGFLLLAFGLIDSEHELTFDLLTLKSNNAYLHDETLIFILLFYGFAIRMPLFPFHGWLPLLVEQGSLASVAVFIVGLKLGVYAMIRFIFPLVPGVAEQWAGFVLLLCGFSIFYGALMALMQNNIYRLLAFAIISHTGMLGFGIFSFHEHGLEGALLLSLVYGLASIGMLFSISLIHEQTGTAMIPRLGNLFDSHTTLALLFLITALSTMIMPGSLGFDAGHLLLEGVIEEHEWGVAVIILVGHVMAAGFLLWGFQQVFLATPGHHRNYASNSKTVFQERLIALVICVLHIGTGLNSLPLLNLIDMDAIELVGHYPIHSSQQNVVEPPAEFMVPDALDPPEQQGAPE